MVQTGSIRAYWRNVRRGAGVCFCTVSVLSLVFVPTAAHADITSSLVAHWGFEEGTGTTTADLSGNGNTGTLRNGPTWTTGRVGDSAILFDGTNDYVDALVPAVTSYPFTVSAWIRFDSTPTDSFAAAIASSTNGASYFGLGVMASSTAKLQFRPIGSASTIIVQGTQNLLGGWHQITSVYGATNSRILYVDGVAVATSTTNSTSPFTVAHLTAGNRGGSSPTNYFSGRVDDVRFYTRALNGADVAELYSTTSVDTTEPTVSLLSPSNGATLAGEVLVSATSTDDTGVSGVSFYYDSTSLIGTEDVSAPYEVSWDTTGLSNGSYALTAVARDAAGNTATSSAIAVTVDNSVDNEAPIVEITEPQEDDRVGGSTVTLTASSTDNHSVAGVRFTVDGANVGAEDTEAPFSIVWDATSVSDGLHELRAVARDAAGNLATSTAVSVTVDNSVPVISSVSSSVTGTEAEITWTTDENSDSFVEYGYTSSYMASTTPDTDLVTSHSVLLGGLIPGVAYHYRVASTDESGNTTYSGDFTLVAEDNVIATIAPSGSWSGTAGSGGGAPTDPTRTTFKPTAHFTIPPYQDVVSDFDIPVMAFAKGGIEKVRFYVEGNTVDVTSPIRYTEHEGRPYEAYVARLDASEFSRDGAFRVYAEVYPNDATAQRRVISMDLWFNGGGTLSGSGVTAYIDSRATLALGSPMSATAGNRIVGQTSGTMAIVVNDATSASSLVVSPMSLDGGTTQPQFTVGETVAEVVPDGTATGNTSTAGGSLSYYGTSGTYPTVGTTDSPFWHLKAAGIAISDAGYVPYHRATYYFKDGSYSLLGLTGQSGVYQYANLFAAAGSGPTLDYGLDSSFRMSLVDQHIKGFTFREPHTFTDSSTNANYTSGSDEEIIWIDDSSIMGDEANTPVIGFPANGTVDYFTDVTIDNAAQGLSSAELVRNGTITHTTSDIFSHTRAVINSTAESIEQISPSHTDVYQFETQDNAENILIYGLKVIDPIVMNAGLFLTGEDGSGKGSFRDWAVINYLSEENRDDITNNVSHFNFWNNTLADSSLHLGLGTTTSAVRSGVRNNWINSLSFESGAQETGWLAETVFDSNNYTSESNEAPGTATSSLSLAESFTDPDTNDYSPTASMPTALRLSLLDVNGNYRAPLTAIGAIADPSEYPDDGEEEPGPDVTGPVISSVSANPGTSSAAVAWTTDEASDSLVNYSPVETMIASTTLASSLVTSHEVTISGLNLCTRYYYRVRSADADSNVSVSAVSSFLTEGCTASSTVTDDVAEPVSSSGGTVSLFDTGLGVELAVPEDFKTGVASAYFQIKQLDPDVVFASISEPAGTVQVGSYLYSFTALSGATTTITTFDEPIYVTMLYEDADVSDIIESSLSIYTHNGSLWTELDGCSLDTAANSITCSTDHFSDFGLFGTEEVDAPVEDDEDQPRRRSSRITYGCKDPDALNYSEFVSNDPTLCRYEKSETQSQTYTFVRDLDVGMTGEDVRELQKTLNALGFVITQEGPGSPGLETDLFGALTRAALVRFQQARGIVPAAGYFGPLTRHALIVRVPVATQDANDTSGSAEPVTPFVTSGEDLSIGMTHESVRLLQQLLVRENVGPAARRLAENGTTTLFGPLTQAALAEYQQARGIVPAAGYFGPTTRSYMKSAGIVGLWW